MSDRRRMDVAVPRLLVEQLASVPMHCRTEIRWHGGEPLAVGVRYMSRLLEPFEPLRRGGRVRHSIQTNATLIDDQWCRLFQRHGVDVGVSIDGPRWASRRRRSLSGAEAYERVRRGIARLREHAVDFSVIAVVSLADMPRIVADAAEFLRFFCSVGARSVGFNVEETEGRHRVACEDLSLVTDFWQAIFAAWVDAGCRPVVREFSGVLDFAAASLAGERRLQPVDLLPTVTCDGDVVLLSPELAGYRDDGYGDFRAGNLLREPLADILARANTLRYVKEFQAGMQACRDGCRYFAFCRGGDASNRYFEGGEFLTSETWFCQTSRQSPFDVVLGLGAAATEARGAPHDRIDARPGGRQGGTTP